MISQDILSMFKSHEGANPFSIIITDIKQENDCSQESITFTVHQINKSINLIEEDALVTERELNIISDLTTDDNGFYCSKINGYTSAGKIIQDPQPTMENNLSHFIEILDVQLNKTIDIDFNNKYYEKPKLVLNIEKEHESLYRSYSYEWKTEIESVTDTNINGEQTTENVTAYTGVIITFNNLKTTKKYPIISVIIIGDKKIYNIELTKKTINNKIEFKAKVKDKYGSNIVNQKVKFYKVNEGEE